MNYNIKQMSLPELEDYIFRLSKYMELNSVIGSCLIQRQYILNQQFEPDEKNIAQLSKVVQRIYDKSQMVVVNAVKLFQTTSDAFIRLPRDYSDFQIKTSLTIHIGQYADECDDDSSGSRYSEMAYVLDDFYHNHILGNLVDVSMDFNVEDTIFTDEYAQTDRWENGLILDRVPQLKEMPVNKAAHNLLYHTHYALQDIIRIGGLCAEVNIAYQSIEDIKESDLS